MQKGFLHQLKNRNEDQSSALVIHARLQVSFFFFGTVIDVTSLFLFDALPLQLRLLSRQFAIHCCSHVDNEPSLSLFFSGDGLKLCCHNVISAQCSKCQRGENYFKQAHTNGRSNHDPLQGNQMMSPRLTTIHLTAPHPAHSFFPVQIQAHFIPSGTSLAQESQTKCVFHDANMFAQQGIGHGPRTLALRTSQGRVYRDSQLDDQSLSSSLNRKREPTRERERKKESWAEKERDLRR